MENKIESPRDLELFFMKDTRVAKVYILEFFEDKIPALVVCLHLTLWDKMKCLLSVKYRNTLYLEFNENLVKGVPEGFKTELILSL